jgi:hypothetical protein
MKTFNIRFRSDEKLRDYIYENQIIDSSDILIQVFSHQKKHDDIQKITTVLKELLPSSTLIGTTTDGEIIEGRILTANSVISISIFEQSTVKSTFLKPTQDSFATGESLAKDIIQDDTKAIVLLVSAADIDAYEILKGIKSIKEDVIISGGLCGDGGKFDG